MNRRVSRTNPNQRLVLIGVALSVVVLVAMVIFLRPRGFREIPLGAEVIIVPDLWHTADHYQKLLEHLDQQGVAAEVFELPSVREAGERDGRDDVAELGSLLDRGDGPVVVVGHSYGAFVASDASIACHARVKKLVFIAGFVPWQAGQTVEAMLTSAALGSLVDIRDFSNEADTDATITPPADAGQRFFSEMFITADDRRRAVRQLAAQSRSVLTSPVDLSCSSTAKSHYVLTLNDITVPAGAQEIIVRQARIPYPHVLGLNAGHAAAYTHPEILAEFILRRPARTSGDE